MGFTISQGETGLRMENGQLKMELAKARAEVDRLRALVGEAPLEALAPLQSEAYAHIASSGAIIGRRPQGPAVSSVNGSISIDMGNQQAEQPQQQAQGGGPQVGGRPLQYAPQPQSLRPAQLGAQPMAQPNIPLAPAIHVQGNEGQAVTIGQYAGAGGGAPGVQAATMNPALAARIEAARSRAGLAASGAGAPAAPVKKVEEQDDAEQRFALIELSPSAR